MWVFLALILLALYVRYFNRNRIIYGLFALAGLFAFLSILSYSPGQDPLLNWGGVVGHSLAHFLLKYFTRIFALVLVAGITAFPIIPDRYLKSFLYGLSGLFLMQLPFKWEYVRELLGIFAYPVAFTTGAALLLLALADFRGVNVLEMLRGIYRRKESLEESSEPESVPEELDSEEEEYEYEEVKVEPREEVVDESPQYEDSEEEESYGETTVVEERQEPAQREEKKNWFENLFNADRVKRTPEKREEQRETQAFFNTDLLDAFEEEEEEEDYPEVDTEKMARLIEEKFREFKIEGRVVNAVVGPIITRYEFEPAPGVKISTIQKLADDLALRLKVQNVRIVAPLPGKGLVGIEVPNPRRKIVYFRKLVKDENFRKLRHPLSFIIGVEPDGTPRYENLAKMPHLLIAGTTGSGKSVAINTILASFLMKNTPDTLRLLLIDPKMVELTAYEGIPHLLMPIVKDRKYASKVLKMAVSWMEYRYRLLAQVGAKGLESYNRKVKNKLPYIVIVIDEFADLIMTQGKEVEEPLARLAQMARAVGIHLIVATQRPSVDVITGVIKANFPVRIAFRVPSKHDSRTILDTVGAERLLGKGDMLYIPPGSSEPIRLHGPFISEQETRNIAHRLAGSYLKGKLLEKFGPLHDIDNLIFDILDGGYIGVFTRNDEIALDQKRRIVAEWISRRMEEPQPVEEVEQVIDSIRQEYYVPIPEMEAYVEEEDSVSVGGRKDLDPLLPEAIRIIASQKKASATMLQRKLRVGFSRAARIIDQLEELGIVGPPDGPRPREVLITPDQAEDIIRKLR